MTLREVLLRLTAWTRRDRLDQELADEIRAHQELLGNPERAPRTAAVLASLGLDRAMPQEVVLAPQS